MIINSYFFLYQLYYFLLWIGWGIFFCGLFGLIFMSQNLISALLCLEVSFLGILLIGFTYSIIIPNFLGFVCLFSTLR